jgi:hypothetical protein
MTDVQGGAVVVLDSMVLGGIIALPSCCFACFIWGMD